jgi:hypothetical protein
MMASTNIKKSTIKFVEETGEWNNNEHTFLKYRLHLNNGDKPDFLAKTKETIQGFNVGDEVSYSFKDNKSNNAKIVKEFNQPKIKQMANNNQTANDAVMSQQESIARSVGWNNVAAIILSPEFQKYSDLSEVKFDKDKRMQGTVFSDRQMFILNQCAEAANIIFKQLITKPK